MRAAAKPSPDVVVVGGGLVGCSCAYWLAGRGMRVALLEREDVAAGASGACDGHLCCQSKAPGIHLQLAQRSLRLYDVLSDELGAEIGFRRCGSWLIAETPEEWRVLRSAAEGRRAAGLGISLHAGEEVWRDEPVLSRTLAGGSYCPTDAQIDPWGVTLELYRAARRVGAECDLGAEVREIRIDRGRATGVRTASGDVACGCVLVAAGAWSASLLASAGVALPLRPRRGEILVTESMPPLLSSIILHSPYVSTKFRQGDLRPATLVLEQSAAGNLLIGSTRSYAGLDVRNTPGGVIGEAAEAARLAPGLCHLNIVRCFAGLRPCSGDGLPLLGPVAEVEGLFVASGHEGDGIALAPVTGEIVAEGIAGSGPAAWPAALLPSRPRAAAGQAR